MSMLNSVLNFIDSVFLSEELAKSLISRRNADEAAADVAAAQQALNEAKLRQAAVLGQQ